MKYDLESLLTDWDAPRDDVTARIVTGIDGRELLQLRVELGLLQMQLDGRPDGTRFRGCRTVLGYVRRRLERDGHVQDAVWQELRRELHQFNYRRIAWTCLAEQAAGDEDDEIARLHLNRTLRDIDHCLAILRLAQDEHPPAIAGNITLIPTLIFNRARLLARLRAIEHRYDEAIEEAEAGAAALELALETAGYDDEQRDEDAGIAYLRQLAQRLREQSGVRQTLAEQLSDAIDREDFEAAARLHDQLRGRRDPRGGWPETM